VAGDAAWDWNLVNHKVWRHERFSDRYHDMTGIVDANGHWWEERVHPEDRERVAAGLEAVITSGGQYWSDEYRFRITMGDVVMY
jgi:PAS domain-containing protein